MTTTTQSVPTYLGLDSGETAGWAHFDQFGDPIGYGQFRYTKATEELNRLFVPTLKVCIAEDYKNYPWMQKNMNWSDNKTSQMIGKIEMMCEMREVELVKQMATCYHMGLMYMGMELPKNHAISHQYVAMAHVVFYLQKIGVNPAGKFMHENST